jgi:isoquinoline 1-oxidoreductase alpha subunit
MAVRFTLNARAVEFAGDPAMPLLWYLRDHAGLTGTKYGCGIGACGACTVHVDDRAQRSCVTPLAGLEGKRITTIEGLFSGKIETLLQQTWREEDVAQCGWCQAGQIMAASDLLARKPEPTDADIDELGNICRCGTYPRIRRAILTCADRARRLREGV